MKIKDEFLSAAVLMTALFCASCSTDNLASQQQAETKAVSLKATLDGSQTRAGINKSSDNTHTLYWHENDAILVQTKTTGDPGIKFEIASGTAIGATSATFNGQVGIKEIGSYAVYPYRDQHRFTGEKSLSYYLPDAYAYNTVESGIFPKDGVYRTTNTCVPMLGKIEGDKVSFKHLCGLAVIRIDKMPSATGEIVVMADQKLCGGFELEDLSVSDVKIATTDTDRNFYKEVAFDYYNATEGSVGVFYLPLPTGSYTNLKIKLPGTGGATVTATYGNLDVKRAALIAIPLYQGTDGTYSCTTK